MGSIRCSIKRQMSKRKNVHRNTKRKGSASIPKLPVFSFSLSAVFKKIPISFIGFALVLFSIYLFLSIIAFLYTGRADQSVIESLSYDNLFSSGAQMQNWFGITGALISYFFIYKLFGIPSVLLAPLFFILGYKLISRKSRIPLKKIAVFTLFVMVWLGLLLGYYVEIVDDHTAMAFLCGYLGISIARFSNIAIGWGTILLLFLLMIIFLYYYFNITLTAFLAKLRLAKVAAYRATTFIIALGKKLISNIRFIKKKVAVMRAKVAEKVASKMGEGNKPATTSTRQNVAGSSTEAREKTTGKTGEEDEKEKASRLKQVPEEMGYSDGYQYPPLSLLDDSTEEEIKNIDEEHEKNKAAIIGVFERYTLPVVKAQVIVNHTVIRYEATFDNTGVNSSATDDLSNSLAADLSATLGSRAIITDDSKTIAIEVPRSNSQPITMAMLVNDDSFWTLEATLPIFLGISTNDQTKVIDLAQAPHLFIMGDAAQGKSVSLQTILVALLYIKPPSEIKFVLIDTINKTFSSFEKIAPHFLARLTSIDQGVITEPSLALEALSSLSMEVDKRQHLLKTTQTESIVAYNAQLANEEFSDKNAYPLLPHIVVAIDTLETLLVEETVGAYTTAFMLKLASLGASVGIHLITTYTQLPDTLFDELVNPYFPTKILFKLSSKIMSETLLGTPDANFLATAGDVLFTDQLETVRLQMPFISSHELDNICTFISRQPPCSESYQLPQE